MWNVECGGCSTWNIWWKLSELGCFYSGFWCRFCRWMSCGCRFECHLGVWWGCFCRWEDLGFGDGKRGEEMLVLWGCFLLLSGFMIAGSLAADYPILEKPILDSCVGVWGIFVVGCYMGLGDLFGKAD